jgi:creatinine amidohydrolase
MDKNTRKIRYELMRPGELIQERERCPLIFLPVAPLEYHGPHLPIGMDPINATCCAYEICKRVGKGVVMPTLYCGTERERPPWMLESLGFQPTDWVVGMDFPTALWKSHYYQEQMFGLILASKIEILIAQEYKLIVVVNGHGAVNHMETIARITKHYTHTTDASVVWSIAFPDQITTENLAGHADLYETSLMLYLQEFYGEGAIVDLTALPERNVPIRYPDFSVVDGPGFTREPREDKIVTADPRDATAEFGKELFTKSVEKFVDITEKALSELGL